MADTVSSPLLRVVSDRLASLLSDAFFNDDVLIEIRDTLSKIEALVCSKEDRFDENRSVNSWLAEVKDAAYELHDFIDEYEVVSVKLRNVDFCNFLYLQKVAFGKKLKNFLERLDQLFLIGFRFPMVRVEKNEEEELEDEDLNFLYNALPSHLKQCFAYCTIFPENYRINKDKLIQMWIAEGFVTTSNVGESSRTLEKIGDDYFEDLLSRRLLIEEITRKDFWDVAECLVNDLVYEHAKLVLRNECLIMQNGVIKNKPQVVRRASVAGASGPLILPEARKLRTLLLLDGKGDNLSVPFERFSCLRVLDLSRSGIHNFPASIGTLTYLKYLDLSCTYIEYLPDSIGKLKLLQSLGLSGCYNLKELSKAICKLVNLRNLDINLCCSLTHMPSGIGKLKHLQKLPVFILGKSDGFARLCELNGLDITGRLEIKNLEYVRNLKDAEEAKLHEKRNLLSLGLSWGKSIGVRNEMSNEVLESLRPPMELKTFCIVGYSGSIFPSWLRNDGLPNLVKLSLINCSCQQLPPLGKLPYLKDLYIKGLFNVQIIDSEFYGKSMVGGFPSLKQLELYDMPNLVEWITLKMEESSSLPILSKSSNFISKEVFPCLETLIVKRCDKLLILPFIPNLKNLALWKCNPMLLCSLHHLKSLSSLVINKCQEPILSSKGLKKLKMNSLRTLTINDSDNLDSLLKDIRNLNSLEHLSFLYCDKLMSLPVGLRSLTSLQKLDILECERLSNIPGISDSLVELVIEGCPLLKLLPHRICNLTSLQKLVIKRCPLLESRLERGKGEDWFKIAHIPCIEIEYGQFNSE